MHVTRVLTKEHVLIKQVLHLMDRSWQVLEQYIGCGELVVQFSRFELTEQEKKQL